MKRYATAVWNGPGKEGEGHLSTESDILSQAPFSFDSRFLESKGTNPEELIAAAHAGCFSMKLSFVLTESGFAPVRLVTTCHIELDRAGIVLSHLLVRATIPGIGEEQFRTSVKEAEVYCPVSKILNTRIVVEAVLED